MVNQALESMLAAGLSVIPTREDKRPAVSWEAFQGRQATKAESQSWAPSHGLGVICGAVSGGLFCIDVDEKNDPSKKLMKEYAELIKEQSPDLLDRLVIEKTPKKGYHMVGRCKTPIRNLKLAKRADHEVLIETRGEGGYFCAAPTPDYNLVRGSFEAIPEITPEDLEILLDCARALNQEQREPPKPNLPQGSGITPFDSYDARTTPGETTMLLEAHGWKIAFRRGETIYLKRPGKEGRAISATFNHVPGRLYVFTTSTVFESEHVYKASAVYAMLEHNGDWKAAAKALAGKGYGDRPAEKAKAPTVIADPTDLRAKVLHLYDHGMKKGVSPGWPELAKYYQVVKGQLNVVTGIPSHGKSEFTDALMINLASKEGWNFVVYSPENYPVELHARKLVEKLDGRNMFGADRISRNNTDMAAEWVNRHFTFLDGLDEDVTLDSIFDAVIEQRKKKPVDGVLIDPWNELEGTRPEGESETDFIGKCLKRCRMFARKYEIAFWIVAHPFKMRKDPKTGKFPIPTMYDISGSAHWYNKADNGIVIHRDFDANTTDVIIQKIKFKYYGRPGIVSMKYEPQSGRYREITTHDYFTPPPPRQLPPEEDDE